MITCRSVPKTRGKTPACPVPHESHWVMRSAILDTNVSTCVLHDAECQVPTDSIMFFDVDPRYAVYPQEDMPEVQNWHWTPDFSKPSTPPSLAKGHPRAALFSDS